MRRVLRYGNTTGAYASAAAKAALITLLDKPVDRVGIPSPLGIRFEILIKECKKLSDDTAVAFAIKNAGENLRGKISGAVGAYNASSLFFNKPEEFTIPLGQREQTRSMAQNPVPHAIIYSQNSFPL